MWRNDDIAHLEGELARFDSRNNRFLKQALLPLESAVRAARERWGPGRVGICVGSSTASMDEIEKAFREYTADGMALDGFDVLMHGSGHGMAQVVSATIVLGFPASLGAAAARLIL